MLASEATPSGVGLPGDRRVAGLSFADPYVVGLLFAGVALFAAVGALSHQQERAFSASLDLPRARRLAAALLERPRRRPARPARPTRRSTRSGRVRGDHRAVRHRAEARARAEPARVAARRAAAADRDAADDRAPSRCSGARSWASRWAPRSCSAPRSPPPTRCWPATSASGRPGDEEEHEPNFSITGEAGLNDGLAYPVRAARADPRARPSGGRVVADWVLAGRRSTDRRRRARSAPRSATGSPPRRSGCATAGCSRRRSTAGWRSPPCW